MKTILIILFVVCGFTAKSQSTEDAYTSQDRITLYRMALNEIQRSPFSSVDSNIIVIEESIDVYQGIPNSFNLVFRPNLDRKTIKRLKRNKVIIDSLEPDTVSYILSVDIIEGFKNVRIIEYQHYKDSIEIICDDDRNMRISFSSIAYSSSGIAFLYVKWKRKNGSVVDFLFFFKQKHNNKWKLISFIPLLLS